MSAAVFIPAGTQCIDAVVELSPHIKGVIESLRGFVVSGRFVYTVPAGYICGFISRPSYFSLAETDTTRLINDGEASFSWIHKASGGLFTKRTDGLLSNLVKSRSREIGCYDDRIVLKFDWNLSSAAAEVPVKYQRNWKSVHLNLEASRLHKFLR